MIEGEHMASEKNFEKRIKTFLTMEGCWFIKYWGGGEYTKAGVPDILCCCNGFFVGIEVKSPTGKPSKLQLHNLKQIDKCCGFAVLLYPDQYQLFKNFILCLNADDLENAEKNYELLKERWCGR